MALLANIYLSKTVTIT